MKLTLKILLGLLAAFTFNTLVCAQHLEWVKRTGGMGMDYGIACAVDHSGNVYTSGKFYDTADFDPGPGVFNLSGEGAYIQKLDASGNFIWAKQVVGAISQAMVLDTSGNIFITGYFYNTVDFDPGPSTYYVSSSGLTDIYVIKLDSSGNFLWAKTLGGADDEAGKDIAVDYEDNVYLTGSFRGTCDFDPDPLLNYNLVSAGNTDIFVLKLTAAGDFTWAKRIGAAYGDYGSSICLQNGIGAVYTTGIFMDSVDFDPGAGSYYIADSLPSGIFVVKLDAAGNFAWAGDAASGNINETPCIRYDGAGYLRLAGNTPFNGAFIQKLDTTGVLVWNMVTYMGGEYHAITTDVSGNVYALKGFKPKNRL